MIWLIYFVGVGVALIACLYCISVVFDMGPLQAEDTLMAMIAAVVWPVILVVFVFWAFCEGIAITWNMLSAYYRGR